MAKVAIVTGANTGIGLAIRRTPARRRLCTRLRDRRQRVPARGAVQRPPRSLHDRVRWVWGDLTDPAIPDKLVAGVVEAHGRADVLVNNAGLSTAKPVLELTADDFDLTFDLDVRGSFLFAQAAARQMIKQKSGGSIINITSVHEHIPRPNFAVYAASKAALGMLTRAFALELAPHNIRVNSVAPGVIATERNKQDAETLDPEVPLGRPGTPEEVAALVAWLCTDGPAYVTGPSFVMDGEMIQQVVQIPAG